MRTLLASALALGALTSAALAEPVALTDAQMDSLTAGVSQVNVSSIDVGVDQSNSYEGTAASEVNQSNSSTITVSVSQANSVTFGDDD
jgi:predicted secreted protein